MQMKKFRFGPVVLANAVGNLLNPPTAAGGVNAGASPNYLLMNHFRIVNRTAGAVTYSLFIGATGVGAANTEFGASAKSVAANGVDDIYCPGLRLDIADFLTGFAGAAASLTIEGEGEIGVAG
jgi:hypothetical protein